MFDVRRVLTAAFATACLAGGAQADNWPQFRGPHRDGISQETGLLRAWPAGGPQVLWETEVCEGYAAAAIDDGKVYFHDYDPKSTEWMVRCLTLDGGKELWRFGEKKRGGIRPNHAITRTVPAVDGKYVFSLDPKCVFHCLEAATGKELWQSYIPRDFDTPIPPWYAGQCPLLENDFVLISPGGRALLAAFDKATGKVLWETPDPDKTLMTHASVMPAVIEGVKQYLFVNLKGAGAADEQGKLLWWFPWQFNLTVPVAPLDLGQGRILLTGPYDAETVVVKVTRAGAAFTAEQDFALGRGGWNSEVHTPIVHQDHFFAVGKKSRGQFACLDMDAQIVWDSGREHFGLGSFLLADGMFFVLDGDSGMLRLLEASTDQYKELASARC